MKKLSALILSVTILYSCSSVNLNKTLNDANTILNGTQEKPLTNDDVIAGLREALSVGTNNSSSMASKLDGFYKNPAIVIPFPKEAIKVKETLEKMGMTKQVQEFEMTLNRAAEEAAKDAAPIFIGAITQMTIGDGFEILKGADTAATHYLKDKTSLQLHDKFKPTVQNAIKKVDVTKYWNPLITAYNKIPLVQKLNPDLEEYVTQRALGGLFYLVAQEETKIRKDPMARVTDVLKRVFGSLDKK